MIKFSIIILLLTICAVNMYSEEYLSLHNPNYKIASNIFHNIIASVGKKSNLPELRVLKDSNPTNPASFIAEIGGPVNHQVIKINEKVILLCNQFGSRRDDALALILGHELAHYYKDHWKELKEGQYENDPKAFMSSLFGLVQKRKLTSDIERSWVIDTLSVIEKEADYFSGFWSYVAGYDARGINSNLLDMLYDRRNFIVDSLQLIKRGYLPLNKRKKIAEESSKMLEKLIPVFDAGINLMLIMKYEQAAMCFEYIAKVFPSPEMWNNAGACYLMEAYGLFGPSELPNFNNQPLVLPFIIDISSRLPTKKPYVIRGEESIQDYRIRLIRTALNNFHEAKLRDSTNISYFINSISAYILLNDSANAQKELFSGNKIKSKDQSFKANLVCSEALINYIWKNKPDAKALFLRAKSLGSIQASINLEILNNRYSENQAANNMNFSSERLCHESIDQVQSQRANFTALDSIVNMSSNSKITIFKLINDNSTCNRLYIQTTEMIDKKSRTVRYYFISTTKFSLDSTLLGITLGCSLDEVNRLYHNPNRIISFSGGDFFIFENCEQGSGDILSQIVFKFDEHRKVIGWILY